MARNEPKLPEITQNCKKSPKMHKSEIFNFHQFSPNFHPIFTHFRPFSPIFTHFHPLALIIINFSSFHLKSPRFPPLLRNSFYDSTISARFLYRMAICSRNKPFIQEVHRFKLLYIFVRIQFCSAISDMKFTSFAEFL